MSNIIVALDFDNQNQALKLIDSLSPEKCALKVGSEMFTLFGTHFITALIKRDFRVFLDLKFHDIPNTVANACKACADLGVWMINVHALGGFKMMNAAKKSLDEYGPNKPLLIAVTILTSFHEDELMQIGINNTIEGQVNHLASLAQRAGLDGVVSSAYEVPSIKKACGSHFLTVTPGIRLPHNSKDDQSRVMTPKHAASNGSDYLVIGRTITHADNPAWAISQIFDDLR